MPKAILSPIDWYDKNGCYSGSGIVVNDELKLLYTGNVKDEKGNRESYQCLVTVDKDDNIIKEGPVLDVLPEGYTAHFRDPKVYRHNNKFYFVIGAQNNNLLGRALLYSSEDLYKWNFEGEIKTTYNNFGFMWECPSIFRLNNKDIMIFSPQGLEKEEYKNQNIYQSGYIVGDLNYENLEFNHNEFEELDYGTDFYAPQVFIDNKSRTLMYGWMGLPEEEEYHETSKLGYVHCLTMVRELKLIDNILYQSPVEEMKNVRKEKLVEISNSLTDSIYFNNLNNNSYELILDIDKDKASKITLEIAKGSNECSKFTLDFNNLEGILDNREMQRGMKSVRKLKIENEDNHRVNIFVDRSAIEIYYQDGRKVLSSRIYPKDGSNGLLISSLGKVLMNNLTIYSMGGFKYE